MKQTKWFLLCCLLPIFLTSASAADQVTFLQSDCQEKGVYNQGSIYQENLYLLLSNLTSKANTNNFYNFTSGELPNRVYGLFLCSSVHMGQDCQDCITMATGELQRRCPSNLGAIIWYAECMLRYANHSIFSINDISVYYKIEAGPAKYSQYSQQLSSTVTSLLGEVNTKSSSLKSATTVVYVTKDISFNSYVDCTPDPTNSECSQCLATALTRLQFKGTQIGRLLQPSCRLMYVFMNIGFLSQEKMIYVASGILSAITAASLLLNVLIGLKRRNVKRELAGLDEIERMENLHLPFDALKEATDNFSATNRLGQGGFGIVYMGTLADGQAVAVKRLSDGSGQGIREFKTEACLAAKLQHKNLVKLYGFCLKGEEMLLVYEFLRNKSLDKFLFDPRQEVILNWETRYKIIMGTMQGLMYLHEDSIPNIIHRDLKPSNILLDEDMNPKLADFGMAKLFGADQTQGNTSKIVGTFGYMAPEYARTGNYSAKSDMFSLGVILLEIISGLKNSIPIQDAQNENLLNYARRLWLEGNYLKLVDSALANDLSEEEVNRCVEIALQCVQEDPSKRPNIASVMLMLTNQPISLPLPTSPPAFPNSRESTAISVESYVNPDGVITGLSPR